MTKFYRGVTVSVFSSLILTSCILIFGVTACGKSPNSSVNSPTNSMIYGPSSKQITPASVPAPGASPSADTQSSPSNALAAAMLDGSISRYSAEGGNFEIRVDFTLNLLGQPAHYIFQSAPEKEVGGMFGRRVPLLVCANSDCSATSNSDGMPVSVELRCTSFECESTLAIIRGASGQFTGQSVQIERHLFSHIYHTSLSATQLKSETLKGYEDVLGEGTNRIDRRGMLEVTHVLGTPIESLSVYSEVTPTRNNSVFSGKNLRSNTDISKQPEYFIKSIGGEISRDAAGKVTQQIFSRVRHPNTQVYSESHGPGRVDVSWNPTSGQLDLALQDASDGGTLFMGFMGEQLIRLDLADPGLVTVDPTLLF